MLLVKLKTYKKECKSCNVEFLHDAHRGEWICLLCGTKVKMDTDLDPGIEMEVGNGIERSKDNKSR